MNRLLASIKYRFARFLAPLFKPQMFNRKRNFQGKRIKNTAIGNTTFIDYPHNLIIHDNTYIGHHNFIEASNGVEIGEGCQITDFVSITSHSSHISIRLYGNQYNKMTNHTGYIKGNISIGKFTFVGPHSVIMPGSTIGKGAIVSAFSFVKGNFPDFAIIAGNPAVIVGDTRQIDKKFLDNDSELFQYYNSWANK
jgi:acetyltransferase-like isoleucine patch superfamily enzyme